MLAFDLDDARAALNSHNLSAWLLYDFHGQNPVAPAVIGATGAHLTRRWFYCIPLSGEPTLILHAIEQEQFPDLPGKRIPYRSSGELSRALTQTLSDMRTPVAMEYYPRGAIPYLSRVDAGTIEWIRSLGVDVVSSHALVTHLLCRWTDAQRDAHRLAAEALVAIKEEAFSAAESAFQQGQTLHEHELQNQIIEAFRERGMVTDHPPIVASGAHAGLPHYAPSADNPSPIQQNAVLLIDLWARFDQPDGAYADLTYMAWVGPDPVPEPIDTAFRTVVSARDAALRLVRQRIEAGEPVSGWELDREARGVIHQKGLLEAFTHRTGHHLGATSVHGDGPHLDDFETHDSRKLIPRLAFTIEPGVYLPDQGFGIRSEIDVYLCPERGPTLFCEAQEDWRLIDPTPQAPPVEEVPLAAEPEADA